MRIAVVRRENGSERNQEGNGGPEPDSGDTRSLADSGLGCDGDKITLTGATQPSIEDLVIGSFPCVPKINFHNPFLAYENGEEPALTFLRPKSPLFHLRSGVFSDNGRSFS
jgi:hypothetical protein